MARYCVQYDSHMEEQGNLPEELPAWEWNLEAESGSQRLSAPPRSRRNRRRLKHRAILYHKWTKEDDEQLHTLFRCLGPDWRSIASHFPNETASGVQKRWDLRYNPNTKKTKWTEEEDQMIITMREKLGGGYWKAIAKYLPGRPPVAIKNRFYGRLRLTCRAQGEAPDQTISEGNESNEAGNSPECELGEEALDMLSLETCAVRDTADSSLLTIESKLKKASELRETLATLEALLAQTKREVLLIADEVSPD